ALTLAPYVSCDLYLAQLAAWLHDSCKEIKASKLVAMAQSLGLTVEDVDQSQGHLLHGPVAACTIQSELRITNKDVLKAISEHTLGEAPMCNLSKVLFVADALEESRPKDYTDPIWTALDLRGSCDLDSAIVVICDLNMQYLIEAGKPIHPRAIIVRNYYLGKRSHHI
ncbi:MAG: bis(5'-nucleosyl)-tetraphosphatase (symmetrical) YqeK, partial [Candidatus Melainabacteria bacterium]|nr:bis(5'-nucleosyl)-tetraphosphatase (symmetrical) YqeK [Candidatus Melainabacteria bacterium]